MENLGEILRELVGGVFNWGDQRRDSSRLPARTNVAGVSERELLEAFQEQSAALQRQLDEARYALQIARQARQESAIRASEYQRQLEVAKTALQNNAQVRTAEEIKKDLLRQLFPHLNDLDRSFGAVPPELRRSALFNSWYRGTLLNSKRLHKTLEAWGLTPLAREGQDFNPSIHDAVDVDPNANQPWGSVARIEFQGYALDNTVLQTARVVISENVSIRRQPQHA